MTLCFDLNCGHLKYSDYNFTRLEVNNNYTNQVYRTNWSSFSSHIPYADKEGQSKVKVSSPNNFKE